MSSFEGSTPDTRHRTARRQSAAVPQVVASGPLWAAKLLIFSLLVPFYLPLGSVVLMPHRIVLLILFVPFFLRLFFLGGAGRVLSIDWLLLLSSLWVGVALLVNHGFAVSVQPFGVHMLEFFGAYLLARVAVRSAQDFLSLARLMAFVVMALMPFVALESILDRPLLLELMPGTNVATIDAGDRLGFRRAQGVFAHPIHMGIFVSIGAGMFWYALRPRWLRFPALLAATAATFFSLSTGALISFIGQAIFIGWDVAFRNVRSRWRVFLGLSILGYILIDLLSNRTPFHVLVTYASFNLTSAYNRILIWRYGVENFLSSPVFGIGQRDWVRPDWMGSSFDNFWLFITVFYGFPGILVLLVALMTIVVKVARVPLFSKDDLAARSAYLTIFGGLFLAGCTVHFWHGMLVFVLFMIGTGMWMVSGGVSRHEDSFLDASDKQRSSAASRNSYRRSRTLRQRD